MKSTVSEAISQALIDLGVDIITHVPGYGATETFESYNTLSMKKNFVSFNEEVAYSVAHGASIAGKRSVSLFPANGFLKAANSCVNSLYTSVTAGFVVILFEDKSGMHSDNVLEIDSILKGMYFPYEVAKKESVYSNVVNCFLESETRKLPYILVIDASILMKETEYEKNTTLKKNFTYKRDILQHAVLPYFSDYQFKLSMAKKLQGNITLIPRPELPTFPDNLPAEIKIASQKYTAFFDIFKEARGEIVTGDTGISSVFALPPYNALDIITYMGGSVPLAIGAYLAGYKNVWAVTGDFSFIAAGHLGLLEATGRNTPLKVVILNNKESAATGGQLINKKMILRTLSGYEQHVKHIVDLTNPLTIMEELKEASSSDQLRIILVDM